MPTTTRHEPSHAEAIATACRRADAATLAVGELDAFTVPVVHLFESQVFALVPDACVAATFGAGCDAAAAVIEIADHAPIQLREQVRALIWLTGTAHPVPAELQRELAVEIAADHPVDGLLDLGHGHTLLRMHIDNGVIADSTGAASVAAETLAAACPDPFWEYENDWIAHLDADHADLVGQLARSLPMSARAGRVRPLGIDRFGIRLRIEGPDADSDIRLPFAGPVDSVAALSRALRTLAGLPSPL